MRWCSCSWICLVQPWNVLQKLLPLFLLPDLAMSGGSLGVCSSTQGSACAVSCKARGSGSSIMISSPSALLVQDAASSPWLKPWLKLSSLLMLEVPRVAGWLCSTITQTICIVLQPSQSTAFSSCDHCVCSNDCSQEILLKVCIMEHILQFQLYWCS